MEFIFNYIFLKGHFINLICCKFMKLKPMDKFDNALQNLVKII